MCFSSFNDCRLPHWLPSSTIISLTTQPGSHRRGGASSGACLCNFVAVGVSGCVEEDRARKHEEALKRSRWMELRRDARRVDARTPFFLSPDRRCQWISWVASPLTLAPRDFFFFKCSASAAVQPPPRVAPPRLAIPVASLTESLVPKHVFKGVRVHARSRLDHRCFLFRFRFRFAPFN